MTDDEGAGIESATVTVWDSAAETLQAETTTDGTGDYSVSVPTDTYDVRATRISYLPVEQETINVNTTTTVDLTLAALHAKVIGERAELGIGVLGEATAGSGTPIGLKGVAGSESGYGIYTPDDARIGGDVLVEGRTGIGTTDPATALDVDGTITAAALAIDAVTAASSDQNGSVIVGENTATTGTPIAVEGVTSNTLEGYGLSTPDNARVDGRLETAHVDTTDSDFKLSAGTTSTGSARNVVQGHSSNRVTNSSDGGSIGGGGYDDGTETEPNQVHDHYGTVGGGRGNQAGSDDGSYNARYATVGGGILNEAGALNAVVAGGRENSADSTSSVVAGGKNNTAGFYGAVPGGQENAAVGNYSFAAGRSAKANDDGSFVWSDDSYTDFASDQAGTGTSPTGANTFHVLATGGIRLVTGRDGSDVPNAGQYLASGGSSWQSVSARAAKQHVDAVDPEEVLAGVQEMGVSTWEYESNPGVRRMGPMAGDFHETFEVGDDPETIGHVDADGVAFAAIQGLADRVEAKDERIAELEAENDELRERLESVEDHLGLETAADKGIPADD